MRLEHIPLLIGVVVAILGLGLMVDAQLPDGMVPSRERRRRERTERHRGGETMVGLGVVAMGAALIGGDTWRFGTVVVLVGLVLLAAGGWLNRDYLSELFAFRGAARRGEKRSGPRAPGAASPRGARSAPMAPGLADSPPRRDPSALRGDREAPIMTAAEGVAHQGKPSGEEPDSGAPPRVRIR